jgi:hypothetical protein
MAKSPIQHLLRAASAAVLVPAKMCGQAHSLKRHSTAPHLQQRIGKADSLTQRFCQVSRQLHQACWARGELQAFCMMLSAIWAPLQKRERREEAEMDWL